ncbi:uncharacterized protein TNCV_1270151 [Trichonephila clavipes]|nr:uncharacterized protein TNCV_1270151 [Trichonephila clavipes]
MLPASFRNVWRICSRSYINNLVESRLLLSGVNKPVCSIRTFCDKSPAHMVQMRGLEHETKEKDILEFFKPLGITPKAVHLKCDGSGRVSGICEVEFATHAEAVVAMRKKNAFMGKHAYCLINYVVLIFFHSK